MMNSSYPDSWYSATRNHYSSSGRLKQNTSCDVCIIGAGLAGLTCALELTRSGQEVLILEVNSIAFGASGRNAGLVCPGYALDIHKVVEKVGLRTAQKLWQLSVNGVDYVRAQIEQFDKSLMMNPGSFHVSRNKNSELLLDEVEYMKANFNHELEYHDAASLHCTIQSKKYYSGVYDRRAFSIHPLNYALRLAQEITKHGGRIFENTKAEALIDTNSCCEVVTTSAKIKCKHVVLATSAYDNQLHSELKKTLLPVATYMGMTEDLGDALNESIKTNAFISDTRRAGDYYRKIGNQLLWGGRISTRQSQPAKVAEMIAADINQVFPEIGQPKMVHSWFGLMGYARHKMPLIYPLARHLWLATGFGGHGLNTTAMAGQLVALAICHNDDRWKLFSAYQSPRGGGIFGRAAVQISYWALKTKDWMDER